MRLASLSIVAVSLLASVAAQAAEYQIDPTHSSISFGVRHMMVSNVKGDFTKFKGSLVYDEKTPTQTKVNAEIEVASIDTRDAKRDEHLRSADFFDVATFPKISFKSIRVEKSGKGKLRVIGELSMHGVTKPVTLEVTPTAETKDPYGRSIMGASISGKLNRKDFGIVWNKALDSGGLALGEEISFAIELEFVKQEATAPAAAAQ